MFTALLHALVEWLKPWQRRPAAPEEESPEETSPEEPLPSPAARVPAQVLAAPMAAPFSAAEERTVIDIEPEVTVDPETGTAFEPFVLEDPSLLPAWETGFAPLLAPGPALLPQPGFAPGARMSPKTEPEMAVGLREPLRRRLSARQSLSGDQWYPGRPPRLTRAGSWC